ncbi:hypothetical protein FHW83_002414 [Duganella sp. SG902]|uniref:hypothetical protein n=1 Tax=unclassified Duganella TaxID=2636909 RepID=UPI0010297F96|nr:MULTISPECIES: hypothetical protein [unclassified Duganella]NVM76619.1 hypothetical protein [Duganella sp. SG902]RZT04429.1 hypothetical protein EV582_5317 [Duganella sp. BK701]
MEPITWAFIGTLCGAAVGALTSIATTTINSRNAASLQSAKTRDERDERRRAFQRETILQVQDCFHDLMRFSARIYLSDLEAYRTNKDWKKNRLGPDLDEGFRLQNQKLSCLVERVFDDNLRSELRSLHSTVSSIAYSENREHAEAIHHESASQFTQTMKALGEVLRSNY